MYLVTALGYYIPDSRTSLKNMVLGIFSSQEKAEKRINEVKILMDDENDYFYNYDLSFFINEIQLDDKNHVEVW